MVITIVVVGGTVESIDVVGATVINAVVVAACGTATSPAVGDAVTGKICARAVSAAFWTAPDAAWAAVRFPVAADWVTTACCVMACVIASVAACVTACEVT